jgi:hypothetical protein
MEYKITEIERDIIESFQRSCIPTIFKNEYMDYLLFVEDVDWLCHLLLKGKKINSSIYNGIMIGGGEYLHSGYNDFIDNINVEKLGEKAIKYYNELVQVVEIMKKYHSERRK